MALLRLTRSRPAMAVIAAACLLAAAPTAAAAAAGAAKALTVSAELDANSHHVWRGIAFSRGMVVNPSLTWGWRELSLNAWANLDRDLRQARALDELDWTLGWTHSFAGLELEPSAMIYGHPETGVPAVAGGASQGHTRARSSRASTSSTPERA